MYFDEEIMTSDAVPTAPIVPTCIVNISYLQPALPELHILVPETTPASSRLPSSLDLR